MAGKKVKEFLLTFGLGCFITIILTWPFIINIDKFYKDYGDFAFSGVLLFYNQQSLLNGNLFNQEKYFNGYQYYPQPYTLAYADNLITQTLLFAPLFWLTNNLILSVNLVIFSSFVLSFIIAFYAINYLIRNRLSSVAGAIVYSFNPLTFSHFPDHLCLLYHSFLPAVFLLAYQFIVRPRLKTAFLFGGFFTLNALSALYYQAFSLIFLPILLLPLLIKNLLDRKIIYFMKLIYCSLPLLLFIPILLYFGSPYLKFSRDEGATRSIEQSLFHSARVADWFLSLPNNLIYGGISTDFEKIRSPGKDINGLFNYSEHTLLINIVPFLLCLAAFLSVKKYWHSYNTHKSILIGFVLVMILSLVLTFGPYFMGLNGEGPFIKLPYYYLYNIVYLFKGLRTPDRFQLVFYLPFSLLCALGFKYFLAKFVSNITKNMIGLTIIILLLLENINIWSFSDRSTILSQGNYQQIPLRKILEDKIVLHWPLRIPELNEWDTYTQNWQIVFPGKTVNGFSGFISQDQLKFMIGLKQGLDKDNLSKLITLGIDYIVIHKNFPDSQINGNQDSNQIEQAKVYEDQKISVIDLHWIAYLVRRCELNSLKTGLKKAVLTDSGQEVNVLTVNNTENCYQPNIYLNKYQSIVLPKLDLKYKLPPVIGPNEEVVLTDYTLSPRF